MVYRVGPVVKTTSQHAPAAVSHECHEPSRDPYTYLPPRPVTPSNYITKHNNNSQDGKGQRKFAFSDSQIDKLSDLHVYFCIWAAINGLLLCAE